VADDGAPVCDPHATLVGCHLVGHEKVHEHVDDEEHVDQEINDEPTDLAITDEADLERAQGGARHAHGRPCVR